jgi:hypothetical protein
VTDCIFGIDHFLEEFVNVPKEKQAIFLENFKELNTFLIFNTLYFVYLDIYY